MTIRNSLIVAAIFIAATLGVLYAEKAGYISGETSKRASSIAAGLIVVYYANLVPKTLETRSGRCSPEKVQATQRFSGWALLLGGLGYSLSWLLLPLERAGGVAMAILATAVVIVAARCVWLYSRVGTAK